jgi:hypothetical protein
VSKAGSVKVEALMKIERYSHVMHISSTVTGELKDDLTSWDALKATLPVGTVSGAPKVRAFFAFPTAMGAHSGALLPLWWWSVRILPPSVEACVRPLHYFLSTSDVFPGHFGRPVLGGVTLALDHLLLM